MKRATAAFIGGMILAAGGVVFPAYADENAATGKCQAAPPEGIGRRTVSEATGVRTPLKLPNTGA